MAKIGSAPCLLIFTLDICQMYSSAFWAPQHEEEVMEEEEEDELLNMAVAVLLVVGAEGFQIQNHNPRCLYLH